MPVGHTHKDIDQMFSCFSRYLKSNNAITLNDFSNELKKAYLNIIEIEKIIEIANFKEIILENDWIYHIEGFLIKLSI